MTESHDSKWRSRSACHNEDSTFSTLEKTARRRHARMQCVHLARKEHCRRKRTANEACNQDMHQTPGQQVTKMSSIRMTINIVPLHPSLLPKSPALNARSIMRSHKYTGFSAVVVIPQIDHPQQNLTATMSANRLV